MTFQKLLLTFMVLLLSACAEQDSNITIPQNPSANFYKKLDKKSQKRLAPNKAFESTYLNEETRAISLLQANPQWLRSKNTNSGDSLAHAAIQMNMLQLFGYIIKQYSHDDFHTSNSQKEGLVFTISKYGRHNFLQPLVSHYKMRLHFYNDYEFGDLDTPNIKGQRALFIARDGAMATLLEVHWTQGFWEFPYSNFTRWTDYDGNTFLHNALSLKNLSLVNWALGKICSKPLFADSSKPWLKLLGSIASKTIDNLQFYSPDRADYWIRLKDLVNWQNNKGHTPLLTALSKNNLEGVKLLGNCKTLDYEATDLSGNTSLSVLLLAIDQSREEASNYYDTFDYLLERKSKIGFRLNSFKDLVDSQNIEGDSPLHIAARLKDSYFYHRLTSWGNTLQLNNNNLSPKDEYEKKH